MKTGQFHVKMEFLGNGRRNLISTSVNTETESHKYGNGRTKIENGTGIFPSVFNPTHVQCSIFVLFQNKNCKLLASRFPLPALEKNSGGVWMS